MYRCDDYLGENEMPFYANTESEMTFYPASYSSNKRKILLQLVTFTLKQHYTSAMSRLEWMTAETVQRVSNDVEMRASGPGRGRGASVGKIIIMNTRSPSPQWRDVPPFNHPRP